MKHESMKADRNNPKHLQMSSPNTYVASRRRRVGVVIFYCFACETGETCECSSK